MLVPFGRTRILDKEELGPGTVVELVEDEDITENGSFCACASFVMRLMESIGRGFVDVLGVVEPNDDDAFGFSNIDDATISILRRFDSFNVGSGSKRKEYKC